MEFRHFLCFEPKRNKDVEMGTLGVTASPFCGILQVSVFAYGVGCLDVERGTGGVLARYRIVRIMRKVIVHKRGIIGTQSLDACILLGGGLLRFDGSTGLYRLAPLVPLAQSIFLFLACCHILLCLAAEEFKDILVLVLIDHLSELGCDFRICF